MIWRVLRESKGYGWGLTLLLALSLLSVPLSLLLPFPLRFVVDHVITSHPIEGRLSSFSLSQLTLLACALEFVLIVANQGVTYCAWVYQVRLGDRLGLSLRLRLFQHVQKLSLRFHDERGIGELVYQLQNDVASMQSLAVEGLIPFASALAIFIAMAIVAFRLDASLTLITLIVLPMTLILASLHMPHSRKRWAKVKDSDQAAVDVLQQALGATRVVRAFAQENREGTRLDAKSQVKFHDLSRATVAEGLYGLVTTMAIGAASAAALYLGVMHVRDGRMTLGDFLVVMAYLAQILRPIDRLSKYVSSTQSALASGARVLRLFDVSPEVEEKPLAIPMRRARGEVEFVNVTFGYRDEHPIIQDFSLHIQPGTRVGLIGPTGSGKTTVLSLLLRFFDPLAGKIRLDGHDLRDLRIEDLRRQFAVILQEPVLFMGTVAENIAYGRPQASRAEIIQAAQDAEIHDFICSLSQGYDTLVGERGMNMSGGERQRLSIARAFLIDAPTLLMDEPTSHLDATTQAALTATLEKLQRDRTTFTVSHRPELLEHYDVVLNTATGELKMDRLQSRQKGSCYATP